MDFEKDRIAQLQLPDPADADPHPRLLLEGRGIHAGECFSALFPDGWHDITGDSGRNRGIKASCL